MTWARIGALTGPEPNRSAILAAAAAVARSRPAESRPSISLRSGEPWHVPMATSLGDAAVAT